MTWEIAVGIIAFIGFIITIVKTVTPLTQSITRLNCNVEVLTEKLHTLNDNDGEQDKTLADHEIRIVKLEDKVK